LRIGIIAITVQSYREAVGNSPEEEGRISDALRMDIGGVFREGPRGTFCCDINAMPIIGNCTPHCSQKKVLSSLVVPYFGQYFIEFVPFDWVAKIINFPLFKVLWAFKRFFLSG